MFQTFFTIKETLPLTYQPSEATAADLSPAACPAPSFVIVPTLIQQVYDNLVAQLGPLNFSRMQKRLERGLQVALSGKVTFTDDPHTFIVAGQSRPAYTVDLLARTCDCPDCNAIPANYCKHRVAAYLLSEAIKIAPAPEPVPEAPPEPVEVEPDCPLSENPEIVEVVNVSYVTMRYHGRIIHLELVETSDGQISTRVLLPDMAPVWINSSNRSGITNLVADSLAIYSPC